MAVASVTMWEGSVMVNEAHQPEGLQRILSSGVVDRTALVAALMRATHLLVDGEPKTPA
jgi:hypothetical protein